MSYQPGLEIAEAPCEICHQTFLTRHGSVRKICLKCTNAKLGEAGPIGDDIKPILTAHTQGQS